MADPRFHFETKDVHNAHRCALTPSAGSCGNRNQRTKRPGYGGSLANRLIECMRSEG